MAARRKQGSQRIRRDKKMDRFAYGTAAELAVALVALDAATSGKYFINVVAMRRELVLCLGNAAEMTLELHQYPRALAMLCY